MRVQLRQGPVVAKPDEGAEVGRADADGAPGVPQQAHDHQGAGGMPGTNNETIPRARAHGVKHFHLDIVDVRFHWH